MSKRKNSKPAGSKPADPQPTDIPAKPPLHAIKPSPRLLRRILGFLSTWRVFERAGILAGIVYAVITYLSWKDLRHNFMVDERAWLKVQIAFPPTQDTQVPMKIINIGKIVATSAHFDADLELVDSHSAPSFRFKPWHTIGTFQVMFPNNAENPIPVIRFDPDGNKLLLTEPESNDLAAGNTYAVVYGQVVYADQFGQHWTRFCYSKHYNNDPSSLKFNDKSCSDYNAVGKGAG